MGKQCVYTGDLGTWRCTEKATTRGGRCIFHDRNLKKEVDILKDRVEKRLDDETEDLLCFDGSIFPDGISFKGLTFNRRVSFVAAQFHGETAFEGAQFRGSAHFGGARFLGQGSFSEAQFDGKSIFGVARFRGQASFRGAQFHGEAAFGGARFQRQTSFNAQFHGPAAFGGARFQRQTSFNGAQFRGEYACFEQVQFQGETIFAGIKPKQVFLEGETNFERMKVGDKGRLVFEWVDLSRTRFLHVDFLRIDFFDVSWNHPPAWRIGGGWRSRLYDEERWAEDRLNLSRDQKEIDTEYLPHLGRLYRALKSYYREAGENRLVGQFQYGLMEVQWNYKEAEEAHKGASPLKAKLKKWFSWEALYRYCSGYGEDYAWAGLVLVGALALFAGCYWLLGVPVVDNPPKNLSLSWKLERWLDALLYSFQAGTLSRVSFYDQPTNILARYLHLFESVLVPVQFGFFLFALRNRFRR